MMWEISDYADLAGKILKSDVEVVALNDGVLTRTYGTGSLSGDAPLISDGAAYSAAFEKGKPMLIQAPRRHEACSRCQNKSRCIVVAEAAFPILVKTESIGAIGALCSAYPQRSALVRDPDLTVNVLSMVAKFAADLYEHASKLADSRSRGEAYRELFAQSDKHLILANEANNVVDMNRRAESVFGASRDFARSISVAPDSGGRAAVSVDGVSATFKNADTRVYPGGLRLLSFGNPMPEEDDSDESTIRPLADMEREAILRAVEIFGDTTQGKKDAAEKLGIGVATLYRKLGEIK